MKRIICLVLALIMVFSLALVGCQGDTETKTGAGAGEGGGNNQATTSDPNSIYDAPIKKLNREITIIRRSGTSHLAANEIYAESITGEKLNDAVYSRNAKLTELYGITFKDALVTDNLKTELTAGEYMGDIIFHVINTLKSYANSGLLVDWASLDNIDLNKNWWNQNLATNVNIGGKSFFITGDAATLDDRATWALFFNKGLVADAQLESPYKLAERGEWTVTKMLEYVNAVAENKNDDGVAHTLNTDIVGYGCSKFSNWAHVAGAGQYISNIAADGTITIPEEPKRELLDALSALKPLLTSTNRYNSAATTPFKNGTLGFCSVNLASIVGLPDSSVEFGVIPYPKVLPNQSGYYFTVSHAQFGVFVMPRSVDQDARKDWEANGFATAYEQIAYVMEAFAYHSIETVKPAFFEQILAKQTVRDVESIHWLEVTVDPKNCILDPTCLFNFNKLGYQIFYDLNPTADTFVDDISYDNFVSNYKERCEGAKTALEEYLLITEIV